MRQMFVQLCTSIFLVWRLTLASAQVEFPWSSTRLPSFQVPEHYNLTIHAVFDTGDHSPDDGDFRFFGEVSIHIEVNEPTTFLIVHQHELEIDVVELSRLSSPSTTWIPLDTRYSEELQMLYLDFGESLVPQSDYSLHIVFHANLRTDLFGFYRSSYMVDDAERFMGSTQFSSIRARKAFPCLDELELKATFQVTLIGDFSVILGNMPVKEERVFAGPNARWWVVNGLHNIAPRSDVLQEEASTRLERELVLETTPRMSTYLIAWVFCEFESTEVVYTQYGIPIQAYTEPGRTHEAIASVRAAAVMLDHFTDRFQMKYPLPKLDFVAVPEFYFGAMENWGLVTFDRSTLLFDPTRDKTSRKDSMMHTLAHELAHKWFGNTITPNWWDEAWLKEGFATVMASYAIDAAFPDWGAFDLFQSSVDRAFAVDDRATAHAIKISVETPEELITVFTTQAYQKGASILQMFGNRMNRLEGMADEGGAAEGPWWDAMVEYLRDFEYGNVESDDLFGALAPFVIDDFDIEAMQASWVLQPGYPVLTLSLVNSSQPSQGYLLRQSRYVEPENSNSTQRIRDSEVNSARVDNEHPSEEQDASSEWFGHSPRRRVVSIEKDGDGDPLYELAVELDEDYRPNETYDIPVNYKYASSSAPPSNGNYFASMGRGDPLFLPWTPANGWVKLNVDSTGYYRVQYDDVMWRLLTAELLSLDASQETSLSTRDRIGLVRDVFTFANAPEGATIPQSAETIIRSLDLVQYLMSAKETSFMVWQYALQGLSKLALRLVDRSHGQVFERFVSARVLPYIVSHLGVITTPDGSEHGDAMLRELVLDAAVKYGYDDGVLSRDIQTLMTSYLDGEVSFIPPDIEASVWNGAVRYHPQIFFDRFAALASDDSRARAALRFASTPAYINRFIDGIFDGTLPRSVAQVEILVNQNRDSLQPLLAVMNRWERFCREWCDEEHAASQLFRALLSPLNSNFERDLVMSFFQSPDTYMGETDIATEAFRDAVKTIDENISWVDRIGEKVFSYISSEVS